MIRGAGRPWFGLLADAPESLAARLQRVASLKTLLARGWAPEQTLLYVPQVRAGYELGVVVVARTVALREDAPALWALSTIGLCELEQGSRASAWTVPHFELAMMSNNSETEDPIPARLGVALHCGADSLPGWDWNQVVAPSCFDWLSIAGEEIGDAVSRGTTFAVGDTLTLGIGTSAWTRSKLEHSVILPPPPTMLSAGMAPFDTTPGDAALEIPEPWYVDSGAARRPYGFYWLLPVSAAEHASANADGTWNMFADLAQAASEAGQDVFSVAFDWLR